MTEEQIQEIRQALSVATPGPWMWENDNRVISVNPNPGDEFDFVMEGAISADVDDMDQPFVDVNEHDALLIANAPTWITQLLADLETLQLQNKQLIEDIQQIHYHLTKEEYVTAEYFTELLLQQIQGNK